MPNWIIVILLSLIYEALFGIFWFKFTYDLLSVLPIAVFFCPFREVIDNVTITG